VAHFLLDELERGAHAHQIVGMAGDGRRARPTVGTLGRAV
jgi:hypothetical protein